MKTVRSDITTFGGIVPILKQMKDFGIPRIIRKCLGKRLEQSKYSNADIIISWILTNYCGGQRLQHITEISRNFTILNKMGLKTPSHDTLGRAMKSLATKTVTKVGKGHHEKVSYGQYNDNASLSRLLVKATKRMGLLQEGLSYTLDMDSTVIPTECYESDKTYIYENGIHPMVSCIGKLPVYIGMRSGNVSPQTEIKENLQKTIFNLNEEKIKVGKVRMDSAGYGLETFKYLDSQNIKFYVAARHYQTLMSRIRYSKKWESALFKTTARTIKCECTNLLYKLKNDKTDYRVAVLRKPKRKSKKESWVSEGKYSYKIIITNDHETSAEDIIHFYNQRGTSEQNFDVLKNHHGWRYPPFSFLNQNLVFLIIAALANNIYHGVVKNIKDKLPNLNLGNMRLNKFKSKFINVICELINGNYIFLKTKIEFEKIM